MKLCRDPADADLIVDLSNVCSREFLAPGPKVALYRLERAVDVFGVASSLPDPAVFAVADESLRARLTDAADKRRLRELVDEGLVEMLPGADPRILELVELTGVPAMSWDGYGGHRDVYPWIQGDKEHFVCVVAQPGGGLVLQRRDMGVMDARKISERAEADALKAARLLTDRGQPDASVLGRWWKCQDNRCSLFGDRRNNGQPVPLRVQGQVVCSLHRTPLTDAGPRPAQAQVVVTLDGRPLCRLTVTEGEPPLQLGRTGRLLPGGPRRAGPVRGPKRYQSAAPNPVHLGRASGRNRCRLHQWDGARAAQGRVQADHRQTHATVSVRHAAVAGRRRATTIGAAVSHAEPPAIGAQSKRGRRHRPAGHRTE